MRETRRYIITINTTEGDNDISLTISVPPTTDMPASKHKMNCALRLVAGLSQSLEDDDNPLTELAARLGPFADYLLNCNSWRGDRLEEQDRVELQRLLRQVSVLLRKWG